MDSTRFFRFSVFVLLYNVAVIVWGAFVRASGSGAGCGQHWPLCNGEMLPSFQRFQTLIEFSHRLSSGICLLLVFTLGHFAYRLHARGSLVRRVAFWSMVAIVIEALIGAALVLLRLVEHDRSLDRAVSIVLHLGNTCFLVGSLTLLAWVSRPGVVLSSVFPKVREVRRRGGMVLTGFIAVAALGALTALGDTLFKASSFEQGWVRDWARDAHFLERLRVVHPVLALLWLMAAIPWLQSVVDRVWARRALILLVTNLLVGAVNVLLAAPVAIQLLHLGIANLLWICLVLSWVSAGSESSVQSSR